MFMIVTIITSVVGLNSMPFIISDVHYHPQDFTLPVNMRATTSTSEAIIGASYAVHAVPVQSSRVFLQVCGRVYVVVVDVCTREWV